MAILRLHVQFFLCCVCWYCGLVLSPDESPDSLSASWDDTGRARSSNREVFTINTDARCHFRRLCPSCKLRSRPETNLFGFYFGDENSGFFLACVQLSPPLKLSPRSFEGRGRYTVSSPAVSGPSVPGVQIVECGTKEEREKKIRRIRGRGLSPLPHPLFVCLFFFFSAYIFFSLSPRSELLEQDSE